MATTIDGSLDALADLGFSELEARVYSYLLSSPPATGYRIAQEIDKPTANTYKAISSLEARGAIWVDRGESRVCRAVPPEELLSRLSRSFEERRRRASAALADLHQPDTDDRVYQIRTVDALQARARTMVQGAEGILLADLFPALYAGLRPDLLAAIDRGVEVAVKLYEQTDLPGARVVVEPSGVPQGAWPGEQISLVVDAREHLLGLVSPDLQDVRQAVWSASRFLSCMHHNHVASDLLLTLFEGMSPLPFPSHEIMQEAMGITLLRARPAGLEQLSLSYESGARYPMAGSRGDSLDEE